MYQLPLFMPDFRISPFQGLSLLCIYIHYINYLCCSTETGQYESCKGECCPVRVVLLQNGEATSTHPLLPNMLTDVKTAVGI